MCEIIDILYDVTNITKGLKFVNIKVVGTDTGTEFKTVSENRNVMLKVTAKKSVEQFKGTFGLGNLQVLRGYLDIFKTYAGSALLTSVAVTHFEKNGVKVPREISFKAKGKSSASYRLISEEALSKIPVASGKIVWDVEIKDLPEERIKEFTKFSSVLGSIERSFSVSTADEILTFTIGETNSSAGTVAIDMATVGKELKSNFNYPLTEYLNVLHNTSPVIKFSNQGFAQILVNTDLATYEFTFQGSN